MFNYFAGPPIPTPIKGQSNEIFDLHFFIGFESALATDQWVKQKLILVKILQSYSIFSFKKLTRLGMIPQGD